MRSTKNCVTILPCSWTDGTKTRHQLFQQLFRLRDRSHAMKCAGKFGTWLVGSPLLAVMLGQAAECDALNLATVWARGGHSGHQIITVAVRKKMCIFEMLRVSTCDVVLQNVSKCAALKHGPLTNVKNISRSC